jgi:hypothetical protein
LAVLAIFRITAVQRALCDLLREILVDYMFGPRDPAGTEFDRRRECSLLHLIVNAGSLVTGFVLDRGKQQHFDAVSVHILFHVDLP